jgi:hypothetical protein
VTTTVAEAREALAALAGMSAAERMRLAGEDSFHPERRVRRRLDRAGLLVMTPYDVTVTSLGQALLDGPDHEVWQTVRDGGYVLMGCSCGIRYGGALASAEAWASLEAHVAEAREAYLAAVRSWHAVPLTRGARLEDS